MKHHLLVLAQDPEAEVRTIAAHHVANFSKNVPHEVISEQVRRLCFASIVCPQFDCHLIDWIVDS